MLNEVSDLLDNLEGIVGEEHESLIEFNDEYNNISYEIKILKAKLEKEIAHQKLQRS